MAIWPTPVINGCRVFGSSLRSFCPSQIFCPDLCNQISGCNRAFELMNDTFFGKCLGTSISPHFASCTHSLIHQMFALTWSSNCENKMTHYKKITPSNPN